MVIQRFLVSSLRSSMQMVSCFACLSSHTLILFVGIGLPGVAASGTIAANTLASLKSQNELMEELSQQGALQ